MLLLKKCKKFGKIVYKFGEMWFNDPTVYDVRMCTASVDHFTGFSLAMFAMGRHS